MKTNIYLDNDKYIAGMTLRDETEPENNNMALHVCKNPDDVIGSRKKLADYLSCSPDDFVCVNQTHSTNFYKATADDRGRGAYDAGTAIERTDAVYTCEPGLLLCCFTADCVPVIFYNQQNEQAVGQGQTGGQDETGQHNRTGGRGIAGVIHSGWLGTVNEITPKVLSHMINHEKCVPGDFHIYIGKAISQDKFEVDEDVFLRFKELGYADEFITYNSQTGKYHIDNQLVVKKQCEMAGIPADRISVDRTCTYKDPAGFSYRRDKECGRHMSFIMKKHKI